MSGAIVLRLESWASMHAGALASLPAAPGTWRASVAGLDAWLLDAVLLVVFPACAWWGFRRLRARGTPPTGADRLKIYATVAATEWLLVAATLVVARRHGLALADIGLGLASPRRTIVAAAALSAGCLAFALLQRAQIRRTPPEKLRPSLGRIGDLLPRGRRELAAWAGLSLTAGICEEILYRGWLVGALAGALGSVWVAVVIGAVLFGVGHAYQGAKGAVGAGAMGVLFGAAFAVTGSLLPGQVFHALFDALAGVNGAAIVARLDAPGGGREGTILRHD